MQTRYNKAGLVRLLRDLGQDVPSVQRANFAALWQAMGLQWADRSGNWHTAYLYLSTVRPALQIGRATVELTPEALAQYGLVEDKKEAPHTTDAVDVRGNHEDTMIIPQFAALCKG